MLDKFKIWSETNPEAKKNICPDLGLRNWDDLDKKEKKTILKHFMNSDWFEPVDIFISILLLNKKYKVKSYGEKTLNHGGVPHLDRYGKLESCCAVPSMDDFSSIFLNKKQDVVYEIITIYAHGLIDFRILEEIKEDDIDKSKDIDKAFKILDVFVNCFNDIFIQFGINIILSRNGIIPRQDSKITEEIFQPVLKFLSDKKWEPVNRDLSDAFLEYRTNNKKGYSDSITHTVSALQAFLQIMVNGKTGRGDIRQLIPKAQEKGLIPNDLFSTKIFKDLESILMAERQATGNPHPKKEYANEKNARLILNLTMIFIQHCIQK